MATYYISECLAIKNENQYLFEHITDNMRAGIDHFYIFDDKSDIPVKDYMKEHHPELLQYCTITDIDESVWDPELERQTNVYTKNFLPNFGSETVWCAFTDTDEIWEGDLKKLCKNNEDLPGFSIDGLIHGCHGHAWVNGKTMKENFYDDVVTRWSYIKFLVQVKYLIEQRAHKTFMKDDLQEKIVHNPEGVKLHHYYYRSLEEFISKVKRGTLNKRLLLQLWMFFVDNRSLKDEDIKAVMKKYNVKYTTHSPNEHNSIYSWSATNT